MRALDYLHGAKWPSLAAITLVPLGSFFLLNWDGYDDPVAEAILGPELVAGKPVILSRAVAEPQSHDWCARSCPTCWADVDEASIGYGTAQDAASWAEATPSRGRLCASLDPPAPGATHLWVRLTGQSVEGRAALPLDAAALPAQPE